MDILPHVNHIWFEGGVKGSSDLSQSGAHVENDLHRNDDSKLLPYVAFGRRVEGPELTWNCKHLANIKKIGQIRKVNSDLGLLTPELTTPLNFLGGDD